MKKLVCLIGLVFLCGCVEENATTSSTTNSSTTHMWTLEYASTVEINSQTLHNCVYVGHRRAFSILSNEPCKYRL